MWWTDCPRRDRWWWEGGLGPSPSIALFSRVAATILGGMLLILAVYVVGWYVHAFCTSWIWTHL
jgi:hypothetical protein